MPILRADGRGANADVGLQQKYIFEEKELSHSPLVWKRWKEVHEDFSELAVYVLIRFVINVARYSCTLRFTRFPQQRQLHKTTCCTQKMLIQTEINVSHIKIRLKVCMCVCVSEVAGGILQ